MTEGTDSQTLPLLLYGDSYRFPDIYHATRFLAPDAFTALEHDGQRIVVTSPMELGRAQKESRATAVRSTFDYGARELMAAGAAPDEIASSVIARLLEERGLRRVQVSPQFPLGIAELLRGRGVELVIAADLERRRRTKRDDEIAAIEATQHATERAWEAGVDSIRRASIGADRALVLDDAPLTAERVRAIVERTLLDLGCAAESTIIAPGTQAADPHQIGTGPLHAGEPIVMDIFPQHKATRYWADMTRTVSKGAPPAEIVRMYEVVKRAQDAGIAALRPGILGTAVHEVVEDVIYAAGYETLREGHKRNAADPVTRGLIHGTGHGVGLEIHEPPNLGRTGGNKALEVGDVVTVEPGVYDPDVGGVRLEDMLVITPSGARDLTRAPRELVV